MEHWCIFTLKIELKIKVKLILRCIMNKHKHKTMALLVLNCAPSSLLSLFWLISVMAPGRVRMWQRFYARNRLSKYLIMSCLSSLNDDNIVTPIPKWPQMWCWSISIDKQIIVVVLWFRHCPGPMHEGLNWEWMWLDFQSPSLNSHAGNTNSSI